jgi:hypothetical protein
VTSLAVEDVIDVRIRERDQRYDEDREQPDEHGFHVSVLHVF